LLDLSISLYLIADLLHSVVDLAHIVRFYALALLAAVCGDRLGEVLGMALMGNLGIENLLAGFFNYTVELEVSFSILASGIAVGNGSFSAISLSLLYLMHFCIS